MIQTSLSHKLKLLRVSQGLTLIEAARKTGVTRATLSELERGHRTPVAPTLVKIANGYGVPVEELLEEPALAGKKAEAPGAGRSEEGPEEERREQLRGIRKCLVDAHEILQGWFKEYKAAGEGRKLTGVTSLAVLSAMGAGQLAAEMVGPAEDRDSVRVYSAAARFDDLVEDIVEALDLLSEEDAQEGGVGAVIRSLDDWRRLKEEAG